MTFTTIDKRKASAIVRIFETGKPLGNYSAVAVLNDGAGISYGASQFTHRSGSLRAVVDEYLRLGGIVGRKVMIERYRKLLDTSPDAIKELSGDMVFRNALRAAGMTREMREAQDRIAFTNYLAPAIAACEGSGFVLPLSLAVIYDSLTHGSYERIRDRVSIKGGNGPSIEFEKRWVAEYVRTRDAWLGSILRLRATRYRTRFFLNQIMLGKWQLELPTVVHGVRLTDELLGIQTPSVQSSPVESSSFSLSVDNRQAVQQKKQAEACTQNSGLDRVETSVNQAAETYDQIERIATTVITRSDRAKSLWTAIVGTVFQTTWAVFGFLAGLPREVWFFAAGVAAALTLMYLYRQIALGRIREAMERG